MGANKSTLTLMGLYNYDETLFDNLKLPDDLDRETVINNILLECAELEVIYPSFEFMRFSIGVWSAKEIKIWNKLQETTKFVYNPIWNKDGVITETHHNNSNDSDSGEAHTTGNTSGSSDVTNVNTLKVSAYDTNSFTNREQTDGSGETSSKADSAANSDYTNSRSHSDEGTIERVEQGNIGLTSTQQLINEEREVVKFNLIDFITNSFRNRFCLLVY